VTPGNLLSPLFKTHIENDSQILKRTIAKINLKIEDSEQTKYNRVTHSQIETHQLRGPQVSWWRLSRFGRNFGRTSQDKLNELGERWRPWRQRRDIFSYL